VAEGVHLDDGTAAREPRAHGCGLDLQASEESFTIIGLMDLAGTLGS
jgi:hypothetical protein